MNQLVIVLLVAVILVLAFSLWRLLKESKNLRARYAGIADIDDEIAASKVKLDKLRRQRQEITSANDEQRAKLTHEYQEALTTYKNLQQEVALLEENLEDISFGVYEPHFSFQTPDEYKTALTALRDRERLMVRDGKAAVCPINWTVGDSKREGQRMVKLNSKLLLRAFNGECEAAVANVSWNNATKMEERIRKSFEAVNKLGDPLKQSLTPDYLKLKLDELRLTHQYEKKRYQDREEQRRQREEKREEDKANQEFEKAREDAESEEAKYQKVLERAREEAARATGVQLQRLTEQVSSFEAKLDEARKKKERAIARAQLTKSGFVYVISNVGSFGEKVYKIGMTRRLEPMDRVIELGGASVPFPFDLHAMLYSDNAPDLEAALHQLFAERRLNLVTARREFYRDVELEEIEAFVRNKGLSAQFIPVPEAREYRETLAKREQLVNVPSKQPEKFPDSVFAAGAGSR